MKNAKLCLLHCYFLKPNTSHPYWGKIVHTVDMSIIDDLCLDEILKAIGGDKFLNSLIVDIVCYSKLDAQLSYDKIMERLLNEKR